MNEDNKKLCRTCAWWNGCEKTARSESGATCCYDNAGRIKMAEQWCRYHSFTTGWEEEKPKRPDSEYVQFLERLRTGPPLDDEEELAENGQDG